MRQDAPRRGSPRVRSTMRRRWDEHLPSRQPQLKLHQDKPLLTRLWTPTGLVATFNYPICYDVQQAGQRSAVAPCPWPPAFLHR